MSLLQHGKAVCLLPALSCLGLFAVAARAEPPQKIFYRPVFRKGTVARYRVISHTEVADLDNRIVKTDDEFLTTETVKEIKPDGTVVVAVQIDSAKSQKFGKEEPVGTEDLKDFNVDFDRQGNYLRVEGDEIKVGMNGISQLYPSFAWPAVMLAPGEAHSATMAWEKRLNGKTHVRFRFLPLEKDSKDYPAMLLTAKAEQEDEVVHPNGESLFTHYRWDFVLDGRTGELVKTVRDTTDFSIGPDKTAHWTVTRTRIADK